MSATIFTIKRSEIEKRLDPFFYRPDFMQLENAIKKAGALPLRNYVRGIASGATPKTDEYEKYYSDKQNGIPFLRVQNLSPTSILNYEDCKYINKETHENMLYRSQVNEGDLLVKITGVGRMAIASVAPKDFVGNTNQHMCVIKTDDEKTSWILAAWLNTDIAEKLASRRATGGTRPALDYPALLSIPIIFDERIYETMKNAVSEMKQKQQQAKQLLDSIDSYLLSELGITLPKKDNSLSKRIFTTKFSEVSGGRWDPKFYSTEAKSIKNAVENSKYNTKVLEEFIVQSVAGDWGYEEDENIPNTTKCLVIRSTEFDNDYNLKLDNTRAKYRLIPNLKLKKIDLRENDLLIEKSGGSEDQPVGRIAILTKDILESATLCFSNFIHKIRVHDIDAEYLFCFLKTAHNIKLTETMFAQTNGLQNLIMQTYFNQKIPLPPLPKQKEIASHIREIREQAKQLQVEAEQTMQEAKKQIEKMILGE